MILLAILSALMCGVSFTFVNNIANFDPNASAIGTAFLFCSIVPILWLHGFAFHRAFSHFNITISCHADHPSPMQIHQHFGDSPRTSKSRRQQIEAMDENQLEEFINRNRRVPKGSASES